MAIIYQAGMEDGVLVIEASGRDDNARQVVDYGLAIINLAVKQDVTRILCDERALEYALDLLDTYQVARTIAERAPKVARIAIVCGVQSLEAGKFWETVAVNRSLQVRVDTDLANARAWLKMPASPTGAIIPLLPAQTV